MHIITNKSLIMNKYILIFFLIISSLKGFGQNNLGTPYSAYGIGLLPENAGVFSAMGGVTVAMRNNFNINYYNPASYTALDSNRWHFQIGINGENVHIADKRESTDYRVAQNTAISMAFRIKRNLFASFGFMQRSDIGYDIAYKDVIPGTMSQQFLQHVRGEGGINEAYMGIAWKHKDLSLGLNASYIFGKIEKRQTLSLPLESSYYIKTSDKSSLSSVLFNLGAQYNYTINNKSSVLFGATLNFNTPMRARKTYVSYKVGSGSSTMVDNDYIDGGTINYPLRGVIGLNYKYKDKWSFAGDYTYQNMKKYREYGEKQDFNDYHKGALGVSLCPDSRGRYAWQRITYMAGTYATRSHIELNGYKINTYGVTLGGKIPFASRTRPQQLLLGVALDMGIRGTKSAGLIQEKYIKVRVTIAFKEAWFVKRKIY